MSYKYFWCGVIALCGASGVMNKIMNKKLQSFNLISDMNISRPIWSALSIRPPYILFLFFYYFARNMELDWFNAKVTERDSKNSELKRKLLFLVILIYLFLLQKNVWAALLTWPKKNILKKNILKKIKLKMKKEDDKIFFLLWSIFLLNVYL